MRFARAAIRHPGRTLAVWAIVLVGAVLSAPVLFSSMTTDMGGGDGTESARADERRQELARLLPPRDPAGPTIVAALDGFQVDDPESAARLSLALDDVEGIAGVRPVLGPTEEAALVATDRGAAAVVVAFEPTIDPEEAAEDVADALEPVGPDSLIVGYDDLVVADELESQAEADLVRAETIALPLALVALVVVFGGFLAAVLPVGLAIVSVAGALVVLAAATLTGDVAVYSLNVVTMFGLGVGIDYGLIVVSRFREELAHGVTPTSAVERTMATAGRTVTYSGLTVTVSLAGLLLFDSSGLRSLAIGGIGVVLFAVAAGLTLLPSLLTLLGHRLRPARPRTSPGVFWHIAGWVRRRAVAVVVIVGGALLVAAVPFAHARFENPDARSLPASSTARQLAEVRRRFPAGQAEPIEVLVMAAPDDPAVQAWVDELDRRHDVATVDVDDSLAAAGAAVIDVVPDGPTQGETAQELVGALRSVDMPFETLVGGEVAELVDVKATVAARLPWALAVVGTATMVLLFLMTGSLVVAVKAVVMNVISLGATFGVLVWVFQDGHLSGLLGFDAVGALDATMPLVVLLFAFGLSMDYEVFLLARIKEAWDDCGDNDLAIAVGLDRTGGIITLAAALLLIVFAGFATGELVLIKQLGVGMAVAVVIDATIVRTLLVPATMTLMGSRNWWAPEPLRRSHQRHGLREISGGGCGQLPTLR